MTQDAARKADQTEVGAMALAKLDHLDWSEVPSSMKESYRRNATACLEAALRAHPGTVSREAVARTWLKTVWTDEYADVFERTNHMEWERALVGADAILSLTPPANGNAMREALAELPEYLECLECDLIHLDVDFKLKDIIPPGVWADRVRAAFSTVSADDGAKS